MATTVDVSVAACRQLEDELTYAISHTARAEGRGRALDVVIWDCAGLIGTHVAELFARRITPRHRWLRWALVTSEEDADAVEDRLRTNFPGEDPLILTADLNDKRSVDRIVRETHMVVAAAGPFADSHDLRIVESCVRLGADYLDVSSGSEWTETLIEKFDSTAAENGVLVVSMTLDDLGPRALTTGGGRGGGVLSPVPTSQSGLAMLDASDHLRAAKALSESVVPLLRARSQRTLPYKGGVLRPVSVNGAFLLVRPTRPTVRSGVGRVVWRRTVKARFMISRL